MAGSVVQCRETSTNSAITSLALAFSGALTAHNVLWVVGHVGDSSVTQTVSDSATNSYSSTLDNVSDTTNNNDVAHWIASDCTAATPTVTLGWGGGLQGFVGLFISEITGVQNAANDGHSGNHQTGVGTSANAIVSGAATSTATTILLTFCSEDGPAGTPSLGTGFTNAGSGSPGWTMGGGTALMRAAYKTGVAAGSNQGTFTVPSGTFDPNTVMVMLKEAGGSFEQEGYRWRNDDGSQTTATWKASQDTSATTAVNNNVRVRVLINRTG